MYTRVYPSFWTGHLEWELQMVQLSATRCSCIAILLVSLVSFATITFRVASWVFIVVGYFITDSIQILLDTPLYIMFIYVQIRQKRQTDKERMFLVSC
jgi:hypothetical protein